MKIKLGLIGVGIVGLLIGYFIGSTKNASIENTVPPKKVEVNTKNCPYIIKVDLPEDQAKKLRGFVNEVQISEPPEMIHDGEVVKPSGDFNFNEFEKDLYEIGGKKDWFTKKFDVNGDDVEETIYIGSVAMNHTPHVIEVVDNGKIIFEAEGANIGISPVNNGDGFTLHETIDWNNGEEKLTRYIFDNGGFRPVWEQKICWVDFEPNK